MQTQEETDALADNSKGEDDDHYLNNDSDDSDSTDLRFYMEKTRPFHSFKLLLVNKQIQQEARSALLRTNQFIYIKTNSARQWRAMSENYDIFILDCAGAGPRGDAIADFKHYTMTIDLVWPKDFADADDACHIMMLDGEDMFEKFVKSIAEVDLQDFKIRHGVRHRLKIDVALWSPYGETTAVRARIHEPFVATMKKHWWSMPGFTLSGYRSRTATNLINVKVRSFRFLSVDGYVAFLQDQYQAALAKPGSESYHARLSEAYQILCDVVGLTVAVAKSTEVYKMSFRHASTAAKKIHLYYPVLKLYLGCAEIAMKLAATIKAEDFFKCARPYYIKAGRNPESWLSCGRRLGETN